MFKPPAMCSGSFSSRRENSFFGARETHCYFGYEGRSTGLSTFDLIKSGCWPPGVEGEVVATGCLLPDTRPQDGITCVGSETRLVVPLCICCMN